MKILNVKAFLKSFNKSISNLFLAIFIVSQTLNLLNYGNLKVQAVSPGPFWTWSGVGTPTKIAGSTAYDKIFIGGDGDYPGQNQPFYFAKQGSDILVWGENSVGQLGNGTITNVSTPTINPNLAGVTKIASGNLKSLGLKSDGTVLFWGHQGNGYVSTPTIVPGLSNTTDVDMEFNGGLALNSNGDVYEIPWSGDSSNLISGLNGITAISQALDSRYALDNVGKVWAWGTNSDGQLGNGTTTDNNTPTLISSLPQIRSISASGRSVLALDTNGDVWAWGKSSENQVGQGASNPQTTPLKVQGLPPIKEIYGASNSSKAVDFSQRVWEWGQSRTGGQSNVPATIPNPVDVSKPMLADSVSLATNGFITVAKRELIVQSAIEIDNVASQQSIVQGGSIQYSYQYTNKSNNTANGLVVSTTLDPSLTFSSCSDSCSQNGQTVTWSVGDVLGGDSHILTIDVGVSSGAPIGKLSNTVESAGTNFDPTSETSVINVIKPVNPPDVNISVSASSNPVSRGDSFTYTLNYSNTLAVDANNVIITDTLDPRISVTTLPGNCTQVDLVISCNIGTVASGTNGTLDIPIQVANDAAGGDLANTAIITSDQSLPKSSSNQITVNLPPINGGVNISKTTDNVYSTTPGNIIPYIITLQNKSLTTDYTNINVSDVLDQRLVYNNDCDNSCQVDTYTSTISAFNITTLQWTGLTIPAGGTLTIKYSATIKNDAASGDLWNTAILNYSQCSPNCIQGNKSSSISVLILEARQNTPNGDLDFTVTKTASNPTPKPGDIVDYTITVAPNATIGTMQFTDVLDPRLTFVSCNVWPSCNQNGQTITFNQWITPDYGNVVIHIIVKINDNAAPGILSNTVLVDDGDPNKDPQAKSATAVVEVKSVSYSPFQVSKTSSKSIVNPGDNYEYTINYANIGTQNLDGVVVIDTLDPRLTFNSCTGGCIQSGHTISWNIGTLNAGDVNSFSVNVTVNNSVTSGILANSAVVSANQTSSVSGVTYVRIVVPQVNTSISLDKTASVSSVTPRGQITYSLHYTNTSNVGLTGGVVSDTLDPRLDFVSCSNSCTQSGQNISWNLGNLNAGDSSTVTIVVNVKSNATLGTITNTGFFDTNETSSVSSSVNVYINQTPTINLNKTASVSSVTPRGQITYSLHYTNTSNVGLTGGVVSDTLDPRLDFVSCSNSCTQSGQNISWNLGNLNAGDSSTVTIVVNVKSNATLGTITNTGFFDTNETSSVSSSVNVSIQPIIPLILSETPSVSNVDRGQTYAYTINYTNANLISTTNTVLSYSLDPRLDFVSCSNSCTQSGQNISWNLGNLNANSSGSLTLVVKVKNLSTSGVLANTVIINSTETGATSAIAFVSINRIYQVATPTITKSQNKADLYRGDSVIYTINYENTSDTNFSNAVVTDILNSNLSFVSCSNSCTQSGQNISWNIGSLPIGATGSFTINANVRNNAGLGLLQNTASISTTEAPTIQASSFGSVIINDPILFPILNITKSSSVSSANRGDSYTYTINYNNGPTAVTNGMVNDTLDSRLDFVSCSNSCTQSGQNISWNLGSLAANASGSFTVTVVVKNNAAVGGLDNVASIHSTETASVNSNRVTVAIVIPDNPKLSITKSANKSIVAPGENVIYTINYTNTANQPTTGVVITDVLNSNFTLVSPCSGSCNYNSGTRTLTYTIGSLANNASGSITIEVQVNNSTPNTLINNSASIDSNETPSSSRDVSVAVIANPTANISLVKSTSASTLHRGNNLTYNITYANSSVSLTNAVINDTLDSNLSFISCSNSCTQSGQNITWNIGNLSSNQSGSVSVTVQVKTTSILGSIDNTAQITSIETAPKTANAKIAVIIDDPTPILNLNLTPDNNNVNPGQNINYTVNYSNPSNTDVTNTQIQTTLDPGVSLVTPCTVQCSQTGQNITWNIGNLTAGASGSLSFEVKVDNNANYGLLTNTLNITSTQSAPSSFASSVAIVPAPASPRLIIIKSSSVSTANRAQSYLYTLTYQNGSVPVTNATITDTLDSRLTFQPSTGCSAFGQIVTCNLGNLASGASGIKTINVTVKDDATIGGLDNTASVSSSETASVNSNKVTVAITIPDNKQLTVTSSASNDTRQPGESLTYTINYKNTANIPINNGVITETLDNRLHFVSCSNSCTQSGQDITWNLGSLADQASGSVSINVTVDNTATAGLINNTAVFDSTETQASSSLAAVAVVKNEVASLSLSQLASGASLHLGDTYSYTISYLNGNLPVTGTTLSTTLDSRLENISCSQTCTISGQNISWNLGSLTQLESGTRIFQVRVKADATVGALDNVVTIDSAQTIPINNTERVAIIVDPQAPYLKVDGSASPSKAKPGDNVTFTVNYENPSATSLTGAVLTVPMDANSFVFLSNSNVSTLSVNNFAFQSCTLGCNLVSNNISWNLGNLPSGQTGSVTFTVQVKNTAPTGLVEAGLNITSAQTKPTNSKAGLAIVQDITPKIDLSANPSSSTVFPGNNLNYNISYQNSAVAVTNAIVSTTLDPNLTFVGCSSSCTQSGQNISWTLGNLFANQAGILSLNVKVKNSTPVGALNKNFSVISNETTAVTAQTTVAIINSNSAADPRLSISLSTTQLYVNQNMIYSYKIDYQNTSGQTITDSFIKNTLDKRLQLFQCFNCTQNGSTLNWNLGTLTPNQAGSLTYQVKVNDDAKLGTLSNIAIFGSTQVPLAGNSIDVLVQNTGFPVVILPKTGGGIDSTIRTGGSDDSFNVDANSLAKNSLATILYISAGIGFLLLCTLIEFIVKLVRSRSRQV